MSLINISTASKILSVPKATLRTWSKNGTLQCVTTKGGHRKFDINVVNSMKKQLINCKFIYTPKGFWKNKTNCLIFLKSLGKKLQFTSVDDWYTLKGSDVIKHGGRSLFLYYTLYDLLKLIHPHKKIYKWLCSGGVVSWDEETTKNYIKWFTNKLKIKTPTDWYSITQKDFIDNNGWGLLTNKYNSSIIDFVKANFVNYEWKDWLFKGGVKNGFWNDLKNRKEYIVWLGNMLQFNKPEDWYKITKSDFLTYKGSGLLSHCYNNSPNLAVLDVFPNYTWDIPKFYTGMKKQHRLYCIIKGMFPNTPVLWNHKHKKLKFTSGRCIELDIYLPEKNIAIEYQGEQHFLPKWGKQALSSARQRDKQKKSLLKKHKISLLEVTYKWIGDEDSISQSIKEILNERFDK
jgi:hypothetical protein